jgi:hypothetical protein
MKEPRQLSQYGLAHLGITLQFLAGARDFSLSTVSSEADHSLLSTAVVKNAWSYKSISPSIFMAW